MAASRDAAADTSSPPPPVSAPRLELLPYIRKWGWQSHGRPPRETRKNKKVTIMTAVAGRLAFLILATGFSSIVLSPAFV